MRFSDLLLSVFSNQTLYETMYEKIESPQHFLDVATDTERISIRRSRPNSIHSEDKRY